MKPPANIRIEDLQYFVTVADHGSLTRAATQLYTSQPLVSQRIGRLERELDTTLFRRVPSGVELTPSGETLLSSARELWENWSVAHARVRDAASATENTLTIGFCLAPAPGLLTGITDALTQIPADIHLRSHRVAWSDRFGGLFDGMTDVTIQHHRSADHRRCSEAPLYEDGWVVVVSSCHRFATRSGIDVSELDGEHLVTLPDSVLPLRLIENAPVLSCSLKISRPNYNVLEELIEDVAIGCGILLLPASLGHQYRRSDIIPIPVTGLEPIEVTIAWRSSDTRDTIKSLVRASNFAASQLSSVSPIETLNVDRESRAG
jgi:DNA-binding transcriptional LysR family regulator